MASPTSLSDNLSHSRPASQAAAWCGWAPRRLLALAAAVLAACAGPGPAPGESGTAPPAAEEAAAPGSVELGEGFVVWESNRGGAWRLWRRELNGSGLTRLTPEEEGRDHCCPHVSPDGRRLTYLSFRPGQRSKGQPVRRGELRLIPAEGGAARVLDADARVPSEQRAVVWRSPGELLYVRGDGHTRLLDLESGEARLLTTRPHPTDGWLINRTLTHATAGWPSFSPYDPRTRRIAERRAFGGCQPYFSHDGVWGFWVAGAGGPLRRIDLAGRAVATILEKNDPRLPEGRGYLYFPMLSRDGTLLAWAASPEEHDFNRSDYDVFAAEVDPATLELAGEPVRLTAHPATDRFPEIFRRPLALGRHRGEAPLPLSFELPESAEGWEVDFGDGTPQQKSAAGGTVEHVYREPGAFEVQARPEGEGEPLAGRVRVEAALPPRPLGVEVRGGSTLVVAFDEPVETEQVQAELDSGRRIVSLAAGADGRTLRVELAEPITRPDVLLLSGVTDRAASPNRMAPARLAVETPTWPSRRRGLVFLWESGAAANLVEDPSLGEGVARTFSLTHRGPARLDWSWAMEPAGGSFVAEQEAGEQVGRALRRSNRVTVELTVRPDASGGRVELLRLGGGRGGSGLVLTLEEGAVVLALRLGEVHRKELFEVPRDRASHLAVAYEPGRLTAYRDGVQVVDSDEIQGDFFAWKRPGPLAFGAPLAERPWHGRIEGIAVYDRVLAPPEVAESARRYAGKLARRTSPPRLRLDAVLAARSDVPTADSVAPYRQALVVFEYRVERVLGGLESGGPQPGGLQPGDTVRVAHWALLDTAPRPAAGRPVGERVELTLEPFASQPQLEGQVVSDTLPRRPGAELYYAVEE